MLLKLAGTVWREGSLSADSRRALTKLNSLGVDSNDPILGYAPQPAGARGGVRAAEQGSRSRPERAHSST